MRITLRINGSPLKQRHRLADQERFAEDGLGVVLLLHPGFEFRPQGGEEARVTGRRTF
jgi:hypothetical protein